MNNKTLLQQMVDDLGKLISIPSKLDGDTASPTAPFGITCKQALDCALQMGIDYGFRTVNKHSYGYIEYGEGDKCVGALCHLDVVPEGTGWDSPPFELTIRDGVMYGRGVADDKGCAIAVLYALRRIKDNNIKLKHRARIILGTNEESGSICIHQYVQNEEMPICSFVPDADFPIINSEKGIIHFTLSLDIADIASDILSIDGGSVPNIVPEKCTVVIKKGSKLYNELQTLSNKASSSSQTLLKASNISTDSVHIADDIDGNAVLTLTGLSAHAMEPHKGDNAIIKALRLISRTSTDNKYAHLGTLSEVLDNSKLGLMGLDIDCKDSGNLTLNLAKIALNNNTLLLTLDSRLPLSVTDAVLRDKITTGLAKYNIQATFDTIIYKPNLFVSMDSPLIQRLLAVYTKHTKQEGYGIKSGGGTYARELSNAVAFGPHFQGTTIDIHKPNEHYAVADFERLVDIYYDAFLSLCEI